MCKVIWIAEAVRALHREAESGQIVGRLRNGNCIARLHSDEAAKLPARYLPPPGNLVNPARGKDSRYVARGDISFELPVECVGCADGGERRAGEDGLGKVGGGVVNQLGESVGERERQPAGKALFQLQLEGLVCRIRHIVAEECHVREVWKRAKKLLLCDGGLPQ